MTPKEDRNIAHEVDGIEYNGNKYWMQEQLQTLPGCDRFHTGWLGVAKKEIVPFIEALNPSDTVFCLFNTGITSRSIYQKVHLNRSLVGALQDRVLIITQHGKSNFQIPYSDIAKVDQSVNIAKDGRINILEKNGTNTVFSLDTIGTDTKLLGNRFCSWVNQKTEISEEKEERDEEINYEDWPVPKLKEILKILGLPVGGKKADLIKRLEIWEETQNKNWRPEIKVALPYGKNALKDLLLPDPKYGIDDRDQDLTERIKEKYKAPEYEAPLIAKIVYPTYPTYLSVLTFILYCLGFLVVILYAYRSEGTDGWNYEDPWGNPVLYLANNITIRYVQLYLFALFGSLMLGPYILYKNSGRELEKTPDILGMPGLFAMGLLFIIIPILYFFTDVSLTIPCWSTLFLLITVLSLEHSMTFPDRGEVVRKEEEEELKKRRWFDACKHEDRGEFSDATRIWGIYGEDEQVLRVAGLRLEYKYVRVHRRILDMEEKGVNCAKLREHLDIVTLLAEDREQGAISFEARIK